MYLKKLILINTEIKSRKTATFKLFSQQLSRVLFSFSSFEIGSEMQRSAARAALELTVLRPQPLERQNHTLLLVGS